MKRVTPETFTTLRAFVVYPRDPEHPYEQYREFTEAEIKAVRDREGDALRVLQGMVGGLIQPVWFLDENLDQEWTVYVNEEGLLLQLPVNLAATAMIGHSTLVGPAVFHPAEWTRYGD